ncbi:uncharacterized protein LOC122254119 [Penaeus japonicus]|uniref:uncharacterized protein LOC122254119 n=1 Tax=Penaeus japonicus TaxID=27405 RepID=UPI001C711F7C|nr:uncharacterized protein LOC122254119 [Penaeus japonicus]XP_042873565.1 uncharacterized protein LOC122254119 [Penaeus japonicus]
MDLKTHPKTRMDSRRANIPNDHGTIGNDQGSARQAEQVQGNSMQAPLERASEEDQGQRESVNGHATAWESGPEPGIDPLLPAGTQQPQLPTGEQLDESPWGSLPDDIHLSDDEYILYNDSVQVLPSANAEVVYYWDESPTRVRDPITGLHF